MLHKYNLTEKQFALLLLIVNDSNNYKVDSNNHLIIKKYKKGDFKELVSENNNLNISPNNVHKLFGDLSNKGYLNTSNRDPIRSNYPKSQQKGITLYNLPKDIKSFKKIVGEFYNNRKIHILLNSKYWLNNHNKTRIQLSFFKFVFERFKSIELEMFYDEFVEDCMVYTPELFAMYCNNKKSFRKMMNKIYNDLNLKEKIRVGKTEVTPYYLIMFSFKITSMIHNSYYNNITEYNYEKQAFNNLYNQLYRRNCYIKSKNKIHRKLAKIKDKRKIYVTKC